MKTFIVIMLILFCFFGCSWKTADCPPFPLPSTHVQQVMDEMAAKDKEVWAWGNALWILCRQLGTCQPETD